MPTRPAGRPVRHATKCVHSIRSSSMAKHSSHMLELAKRGAALRLRELANELDLLLRAFPDLHDAFDADELPVSFIVRRDARRAGASAVKRQKSMSAAAKRAVSQRMKKYWAERRAGHKT
jgi:hypothetical protein